MWVIGWGWGWGCGWAYRHAGTALEHSALRILGLAVGVARVYVSSPARDERIGLCLAGSVGIVEDGADAAEQTVTDSNRQ